MEGNEDADLLAKQALSSQAVELNVQLRKAETAVIKSHVFITWREAWDFVETGRHLHSIQKQVSAGRRVSRSRREESIITRLRTGHTGLNKTLHIIGQRPMGECEYCGEIESVQQVLILCPAYEEESEKLKQAAWQAKMSLS